MTVAFAGALGAQSSYKAEIETWRKNARPISRRTMAGYRGRPFLAQERREPGRNRFLQ